MLRTASSSSHSGGERVSASVPRQSTPPPAWPRTRQIRALTLFNPPPRDPAAARGQAAREASPASCRRRPRRLARRMAVGLRPSKRMVAPERVVPYSSCAGSKKATASAGALTARAGRRSVLVAVLDVVPPPAPGGRPEGQPAAESGDHHPADQRACGRQQEHQADHVRDEAGADQERAAEDHQHAVEQLAGARGPRSSRR